MVCTNVAKVPPTPEKKISSFLAVAQQANGKKRARFQFFSLRPRNQKGSMDNLDDIFHSSLVSGDVVLADSILTKYREGDLPSFATCPSPILRWDPLIVASRHGQVSMAEYLLEQKADVCYRDANERTPLMHAIVQGHEEMCLFLLTRMTAQQVTVADSKGQTALDLAREVGLSPNLVAFLEKANSSDQSVSSLSTLRPAGGKKRSRCCQAFSRGAVQALRGLPRDELWRKDAEGDTLIQLAARGGHIPSVDYLLRAQADIETCDRRGITLLMAAAEQGHRQMVWYLLGEGADPYQKSRDGLTAREYARQSAHRHIEQILQCWESGVVEPAAGSVGIEMDIQTPDHSLGHTARAVHTASRHASAISARQTSADSLYHTPIRHTPAVSPRPQVTRRRSTTGQATWSSLGVRAESLDQPPGPPAVAAMDQAGSPGQLGQEEEGETDGPALPLRCLSEERKHKRVRFHLADGAFPQLQSENERFAHLLPTPALRGNQLSTFAFTPDAGLAADSPARPPCLRRVPTPLKLPCPTSQRREAADRFVEVYKKHDVPTHLSQRACSPHKLFTHRRPSLLVAKRLVFLAVVSVLAWVLVSYQPEPWGKAGRAPSLEQAVAFFS
eukprot:g6781.t1